MCKLVTSSYNSEDCIFLLKDLTDEMESTSIEEKEKRIAEGVNYSEMISDEEPIDKEVQELFLKMLDDEAEKLAEYVGVISEAVYSKYGNDLVIVSLARAGSPVGVLMRKYIEFKYSASIPHYSISIIRGKGIDENALLKIMEDYPNGKMAFVDGWTGKGSITFELEKSIKEFNEKYWTDIDDSLVVLADPARKSAIYGTREDICIPNACLNSTVSGLVSRTIHNTEYIGDGEYHGAKYYGYLEDEDFSNHFINRVVEEFSKDVNGVVFEERDLSYVDGIIDTLKAQGLVYENIDLKKLKLSIGETSRAIIRRKPSRVFVSDINNPDLRFVLHMAEEKGIPVFNGCNLGGYSCVSVLE